AGRRSAPHCTGFTWSLCNMANGFASLSTHAMPDTSLTDAVSSFGIAAAAKLSNAAAIGEPEDQLRAPLETLLKDLASLARFPANAVVAVGESSLSELKTRPDYAVTVHGALVGFVELKAPGK